MAILKTASKFLRELRRKSWQRRIRCAKYWQEVRSLALPQVATKIRRDMHRAYWLLRLRRVEREQEKALAHTATVIRRMCGPAAGPHLKKLYARRVHVLPIIGEVVSMNKSREDLTVPEIQLVMFEFLRRRLNAIAAERTA